MAIRQKTIRIGDTEYVIQHFDAETGLEIAAQLFKLLSGAGAGIGDLNKLDILDVEIDFGKIVAGLASGVDRKGTPALIRQIVSNALVRPECNEDWYKTHFAGNYGALFKLVLTILEFNYADIADTLKKTLGQVMRTLFSAPERESTTEKGVPASTPSSSPPFERAGPPSPRPNPS